MVIDLTKNNSIAAIKNIDEDLALSYYAKLGLDHSSPSQEALSDSDWHGCERRGRKSWRVKQLA